MLTVIIAAKSRKVSSPTLPFLNVYSEKRDSFCLNGLVFQD